MPQLLARLFPWLGMLLLGLVIWGLQNQLTAERDFRSSVQAQLHAPNNKHETLSAYLTGALEAKDLATTLLKQVSTDAQAAQSRSDLADVQLEKTQEANNTKLASVLAENAKLKTHKSTGSADADCKQINEDSKLPYKGWHQ